MTDHNIKNLLNLNDDEIKNFLDSFDVLLTDCDGVLWKDKPFPEVEKTISTLKNLNKKVCFVTNNSFQHMYMNKFKEIGIDVDLNDVINPVFTLIQYLKDINFTKKIYCIACKRILETLDNAQINYCTGPEICEEKLNVLLENTKDDPDIGAVYIDLDINITYTKIMKALDILKRKDVLYLAGATDKILPITSKKYLLGPGAFLDLISTSLNRNPIHLGKPGDVLKHLAMKQFNITDSKRVLFVGDSLATDIEFANVCGFQSLLVLSGITSDEDMKSIQNPIQTPTYYSNFFSDILKVINGYNAKL